MPLSIFRMQAWVYSKFYVIEQQGFGVDGITSFNDAIHAFAINECSQWPRCCKSGKFYYTGDNEDGTALLADKKLEKQNRVVGISKSTGDMLRVTPKHMRRRGRINA